MHHLGFGCVRLTYHLTYKKAIQNLEAAYDAGIIHFDVARLYGFGTAEKILGEFIRDKRDKVTITTKFGIFPGNSIMGNLYVQNAARNTFRLLKKLPFKKIAQQAANDIVLHRDLTVADAERSLHTSLQALKTDYIDYYLLHEPTVPETRKPELIHFLEEQKKKGTIKEYGIGSFAEKIANDIHDLPSNYTVLQTDLSFPFTSGIPTKSNTHKRLFFFSPFRNYTACKELLRQDSQLTNTINDLLNTDVRTNLLDLFLLYPMYYPAASTTLFASSTNKHIVNTAERWNRLASTPLPPTAKFEQVCTLLKEKLTATQL